MSPVVSPYWMIPPVSRAELNAIVESRTTSWAAAPPSPPKLMMPPPSPPPMSARLWSIRLFWIVIEPLRLATPPPLKPDPFVTRT